MIQPILTFDQIELASGVVQKQTSFTLPDQTMFSLSLIGWQDQIVGWILMRYMVLIRLQVKPFAQWP